MKHIHLIPADFEYYNLDDLESEKNDNTGGVCWSNGGENGKKAQAFNIGDTVYIYFHDSRGLTDRILLKAKVSRSDCTDDGSANEDEGKYLYSEYCKKLLADGKEMDVEDRIEKEYGAKAKIKGFYLNHIVAISVGHEKDFIYKHGTKEEAKKGLTGIMGVRVNQTKVYLDKQEDNKYAELKNALEATGVFNNRSVLSLRNEYNDDSCIACTKAEKGIHSFLKQNNLYYFEIHHILQQNLNNKLSNESKKEDFSVFKNEKYFDEKGINTLIYNSYNEVRLCPYHHNILHYGQIEKRKEILDRIMKHQDYENKLREKVGNTKDCKTILKYIYEQYGLEYK